MHAAVGGRFKKEGTCVYFWLIHVTVCQKPIQHYKAIIIQLKILEKCFLVEQMLIPKMQKLLEITSFRFLWFTPWDPPSMVRAWSGVLSSALGMPGIHLLSGLPRQRGRKWNTLKYLVPSQVIFPVFNLDTVVCALREWVENFEQKVTSCQIYLECSNPPL